MKGYLYLPIILSMLLLLTSCSGGGADDVVSWTASSRSSVTQNSSTDGQESSNISSQTQASPSVSDFVSAYTEQKEYPKGTESIKVIVENSSDNEEVSFGSEFCIQAFSNNVWQTLEFKEEVVWPYDAVILPAKKSSSFVLDLTLLASDLDVGKYRAVVEVSGSKGTEEVYAEFEIK